MGFIRGVLLTFVSVALLASLFTFGLFATLSLSLEHEVVKPKVHSVAKDLIEQELDAYSVSYDMIPTYHCDINDDFRFYNDLTGEEMIVPCEVISQGPEALVDYGISYVIDFVYYKEYSCQFWKCFNEEETPLFLISEHSQDHWESKKKRFLLFSLILSGLVLLLTSRKTSVPITLGVLLVLAFFLVSHLDTIGKVAIKILLFLSQGAVDNLRFVDFSIFVDIFFSQADAVFWSGFILGLILIGLGIILKIFRFGFKIHNIFSKKEKVIIVEKRQAASPKGVKEKALVKKSPAKKKVVKKVSKKKISKGKKGEILLSE